MFDPRYSINYQTISDSTVSTITQNYCFTETVSYIEIPFANDNLSVN